MCVDSQHVLSCRKESLVGQRPLLIAHWHFSSTRLAPLARDATLLVGRISGEFPEGPGAKSRYAWPSFFIHPSFVSLHLWLVVVIVFEQILKRWTSCY